jgi:hypothetical protein
MITSAGVEGEERSLGTNECQDQQLSTIHRAVYIVATGASWAGTIHKSRENYLAIEMSPAELVSKFLAH